MIFSEVDSHLMKYSKAVPQLKKINSKQRVSFAMHAAPTKMRERGNLTMKLFFFLVQPLHLSQVSLVKWIIRFMPSGFLFLLLKKIFLHHDPSVILQTGKCFHIKTAQINTLSIWTWLLNPSSGYIYFTSCKNTWKFFTSVTPQTKNP